MCTAKETTKIQQSILGRRVTGISWTPADSHGMYSLESLILEGGVKLNLQASNFGNIVFVVVSQVIPDSVPPDTPKVPQPDTNNGLAVPFTPWTSRELE